MTLSSGMEQGFTGAKEGLLTPAQPELPPGTPWPMGTGIFGRRFRDSIGILLKCRFCSKKANEVPKETQKPSGETNVFS
jgi:hypothetical protein